MNCPNCSDALSERGNFCKACGAQARCMACKAVLEPGAAACVECGAKVGGVFDGVAAVGPVPPTRNTFSYREHEHGRDFNVDFSDTTMQSVGDVIGAFFASRGVALTRPAFNAPAVVETTVKTLTLPPEVAPPVVPPPDAPSNSDLTSLSEMFRLNGDDLELIDNQLKANNGLDYARRLTYLTLYAYELHGQAWVPKAKVTAMLKEGKVLDNNSRAWMKGTPGFRADADDKLQLIKGGRDSAKKALAEHLDPNRTADWHPDKKKPQKRAPRTKKEK